MTIEPTLNASVFFHHDSSALEGRDIHPKFLASMIHKFGKLRSFSLPKVLFHLLHWFFVVRTKGMQPAWKTWGNDY